MKRDQNHEVVKLYCYCDEAQFDGEKGTTYGVGALLTDTPVEARVTESALEALRAYPQADEWDLRTVQRGYFHASEDSKIAHSVICSSINTTVTGNFLYQHTRDGPSLLVQHPSRPTQETHYATTLSGIVVQASQHAHDLELIVEDRPGLQQQQVEAEVERVYRLREAFAARQPNVPLLFPRCSVRIASKFEPGLQVVDFLLWSTNRLHRKEPDRTWFDRLEREKAHLTVRHPGTPEESGLFSMKNSVYRVICDYPMEALPVDIPQTAGGVCAALSLVERIVARYARRDLPDHLDNLTPRLEALTEGLRHDTRMTATQLEEVCSLFIRLFDTAPVHIGSDSNVADLRLFLRARAVASICRTTSVFRMNYMDRYLAFRETELERHPEYFGSWERSRVANPTLALGSSPEA